MNLYELVHNKILDTVDDFHENGAGFKVIQYDTQSARRVSIGSKLKYQSIYINEISGSFDLAGHFGRARVTERQDWFWLLIMNFPANVEFEDFKNEVVTNGLKIPRPADNSNPPVFLDFTDFSVEHGVQEQGSANGVRITFRLNAQVERYR